MKVYISILVFLLFITAFAGCSLPNQNYIEQNPTENIIMKETTERPDMSTDMQEGKSDSPDGEGVIHFTVMIHMEGWNDGASEERFERHAQLLRAYANIFEEYGAIMTIESKEFTTGCINWNDNVLKEMEDRGHAIGLHADQGGSKTQSFKSFVTEVEKMKEELESLDVTVRHVSGVCSDKDWVKVCIDNGFEAVTGTVSYALWSLDEENRPDGFIPYKNPAEGHAAYPWDAEKTILPWRVNSGADWIYPDENGELIIIPSGLGLINAYEETQGITTGGAEHEFDINDINAWKNKIDELLQYTDSQTVNTYYAAWSIGSPVDEEMLEKWLQMIDEYVQEGKIVWTGIPEMIDLYNSSTK